MFCSNSNKIIEWFQKTYVFLLSHFVLCILSVAIILIASYGIVTSQNNMIMKFENLYQKVIFLSNFVHMTNDYKHFKIYFISPKSISKSDLYLFSIHSLVLFIRFFSGITEISVIPKKEQMNRTFNLINTYYNHGTDLETQ